MSQRLTREERIEIVLMSGERSTRVIAADFNGRHPTRSPISRVTVGKLLSKFLATGSVLDLPKCGRTKTVTTQTSVAVLAPTNKKPQPSGISQTPLRQKSNHKCHPDKPQLLQSLNEDGPNWKSCLEEWVDKDWVDND